MKRRLLNLTCAISLALCIATCAAWRRGYASDPWFRIFWFPRQQDRINYLGIASGGDLVLARAPYVVLTHLGGADEIVALAPGVKYAKYPAIIHTRIVWISFWYPFVATAVLPVLWIMNRGKRRARKGCCSQCGYDLRATPVRCPECGTQVARIADEARD